MFDDHVTGHTHGMSVSRNHDLAVDMANLARLLAGRTSTLEAVLADVTSAAIESIPGVDTAGILLIARGEAFESVGTSSELPRRLDELQMTYREGPCLQAAVADTVVRVNDFRAEARWPNYAPAVAEIGVLSSLSFKLYTGERTAGALNLFGFEPRTWDVEAELVGGVLAAHATAAIMATQQRGQLQTALLSRDRIGQAKGIIMERFDVDEVRAFEMLRQLSQEQNVRLTDVAERVIGTVG